MTRHAIVRVVAGVVGVVVTDLVSPITALVQLDRDAIEHVSDALLDPPAGRPQPDHSAILS
jgi:hypothetical protein